MKYEFLYKSVTKLTAEQTEIAGKPIQRVKEPFQVKKINHKSFQSKIQL